MHFLSPSQVLWYLAIGSLFGCFVVYLWRLGLEDHTEGDLNKKSSFAGRIYPTLRKISSDLPFSRFEIRRMEPIGSIAVAVLFTIFWLLVFFFSIFIWTKAAYLEYLKIRKSRRARRD